MHLDEAGDDALEETKEMKVKVPAEMQVRLHSLKVLTGTDISTAVTEAVEQYFERMDDDVEEGLPDPGDA